MSRGAFFLAILLLILGLTFIIAALRGRGVQMIAALQQIGAASGTSGAKGAKGAQTKTR